jgi:deazaflavin-dependent oxidoreductase (nitroreductase family)
MTEIDKPQAQSRVGPMSELYELYLRVMRQVGHYRWFSLFMKHVGSRADRALIRASRGRFSMSGPRLTTMLLTTKGRRTGKDRTVPVHYVRDGPNVVAACENFGLEAASSWPKNLLADPRARIEIGGTAANYLSRPATEEEVARTMPRLIEMWPAHDSHMDRNGVRHVIVFEPVDAGQIGRSQ